MVPAQQSQPPAPTDAPREVFCPSQERPPGRCEHSGRRREFISPPLPPSAPTGPEELRAFSRGVSLNQMECANQHMHLHQWKQCANCEERDSRQTQPLKRMGA